MGADSELQLSSDGEGVRVVAMCTFEAVQDYELGFRQYDVLTAVAKAEEDPSWWVGQIGGKIGLFPSECVEVLKGYPEKLPLFQIFLNDDVDIVNNDSSAEMPVAPAAPSPSASTASLDSTYSSTELETTPNRQRASSQPEADMALVNCYRCNTQVRIKKGQSFYPCECGANVKRPDDEVDNKDDNIGSASAPRPRRNTTASAVAGARDETPKERKKRERRERELKKKQDEEERRRREEDRKFREKRDKGRGLSESQWNRQVDSARERLWRASVIMTHANNNNGGGDDDGSMTSATDDTLSTRGSSTFDVDMFEDARSDSPRDFSSFSSASSGRSLSTAGSSAAGESGKKSKKRGKKTQKPKEQRKWEKEEKKRLKKLEKEEEKKKKTERNTEKKRRNSLFSSSGSVSTKKNKDTITANNGNAVVVTINPITANAKRQQQQMKAMTTVRTKEGRVMSLEEMEREGKKSNWDVSRLFSVRVIGGGRSKHHHHHAAKAAASSTATLASQRAAQQERELQEAARKLEEERKRFAEERQKFEEERLRVMLVLAQEMEGVKMAAHGAPMFPSPSTHPALRCPELVPVTPSPTPSFAAAQSSFASLPSTSLSSSLACFDPMLDAMPMAAPPHRGHALPSSSTSMSTSSLPSPSAVYNPSLTSLPTSIASPAEPAADDDDDDDDDDSAEGAADVSSAVEPPVASPRKPPSGGVFLPFLMEAHANRRPTRHLDDEVALLEEQLLGRLSPPSPASHDQVDKNQDVDVDDYGKEEKEEWEGSSSDAEDEEDDESESESEDEKVTEVESINYLEYVAEETEEEEDEGKEEEEAKEKEMEMEKEKEKEKEEEKRARSEKRKITVAPIQGIAEIPKEAERADELDGSWLIAVSPRQRDRQLLKERERQQQQKAAAGNNNNAAAEQEKDRKKDVIVRPVLATSPTSPKKVSFGGAAVWTSAESPRRKLESMRAEGASQADIDRERRRIQAELERDADHQQSSPKGYEEDMDRLLEKMKQLRDGSTSEDDTWGSSSSAEASPTRDPHADADVAESGSDGEEDEDEDDGSAIVIPEWKRGPPRSLQEMKEYKDFVRMRYEAEKRQTERMLRRTQRQQQQQQRGRGMTVPSGAAFSKQHDPRASWII